MLHRRAAVRVAFDAESLEEGDRLTSRLAEGVRGVRMNSDNPRSHAFIVPRDIGGLDRPTRRGTH